VSTTATILTDVHGQGAQPADHARAVRCPVASGAGNADLYGGVLISRDAGRLFNLLPEHTRGRDAETGEPLCALPAVIAEQADITFSMAPVCICSTVARSVSLDTRCSLGEVWHMQAVQHPPAGAASGLAQTLRPGDPGHGRGIVTIKWRVPINSALSATRPRADSAASLPTVDLRVALWFCGRPLASSGQRPADGEERGELTETNGTVSTVAGFAVEDLATELLNLSPLVDGSWISRSQSSWAETDQGADETAIARLELFDRIWTLPSMVAIATQQDARMDYPREMPAHDFGGTNTLSSVG
jgi:hypothetical protein